MSKPFPFYVTSFFVFFYMTVVLVRESGRSCIVMYVYNTEKGCKLCNPVVRYLVKKM